MINFNEPVYLEKSMEYIKKYGIHKKGYPDKQTA